MMKHRRVSAFLAIGAFGILGLAACDPKDLYGPEEGPPEPSDEFLVPGAERVPLDGMEAVGLTENVESAPLLQSDEVPAE
jgi:hypothetical protein